jgi:hypothetical protein
MNKINKNTSNHDKIWLAIERKISANICALHDEAENYAFKTLDGQWHTIYIPFANDAAGLGYIKRSLL